VPGAAKLDCSSEQYTHIEEHVLECLRQAEDLLLVAQAIPIRSPVEAWWRTCSRDGQAWLRPERLTQLEAQSLALPGSWFAAWTPDLSRLVQLTHIAIGSSSDSGRPAHGLGPMTVPRIVGALSRLCSLHFANVTVVGRMSLEPLRRLCLLTSLRMFSMRFKRVGLRGFEPLASLACLKSVRLHDCDLPQALIEALASAGTDVGGLCSLHLEYCRVSNRNVLVRLNLLTSLQSMVLHMPPLDDVVLGAWSSLVKLTRVVIAATWRVSQRGSHNFSLRCRLPAGALLHLQ
jgi:hypothetical protein